MQKPVHIQGSEAARDAKLPILLYKPEFAKEERAENGWCETTTSQGDGSHRRLVG
jgi:hypothetical protein